MNRQYKELQEKFEEMLQQKTSWGRNELKMAFNELLEGMSDNEVLELKPEEISKIKKTGEFRFQFDDEESMSITDVFDHKSVTISLQQQIIEPNNNIRVSCPEITFSSKTGKKFRLFIEPAKG